MQRLMVIECSVYRFEKHPTGNTVSVYKYGSEIAAFTNYAIGDVWNNFEQACANYIASNNESED